MKKKFRRGQMVSVWHRDSKRHKWVMQMSMARIMYIGDEGCAVQTTTTYCPAYRNGERLNGINGGTSFMFRGEGTWERELRPPVYDVDE